MTHAVPTSNTPALRSASLAVRLGLACVSVVISATLMGGLMGLFQQNADAAVAASTEPLSNPMNHLTIARADMGECAVLPRP